MAALPAGTVTFLFTDLEGSTRLWEAHPEAMRTALARHDEVVTGAVEARRGYVVKNTGDGFLAAFSSAPDAVTAAIDAQLALAAEPWPETGPLRVRMGVHTGAAELRDSDYHGSALNRAARLMSIGHGGQVLVSLVTSELIRGADVELVDLGLHQLRGLIDPEHVFQVVHPGLASEFAPLRSSDPARDRPRSNLPAPLDRFVGRVQELGELERRLGNSRLLTLLGPGGTGKTRLAVQAATDVRDDFDDCVYLVDLSTCRDVDAVLAVTARVVGVHEQSDRPLLDAIKEQIGSQPMLLVFDNFEQVTTAAPTIAELLRDCPELKQLVTSREALNVTGEQVFPIPPLALPTVDADVSLDALAENEAVQLFVERAREVNADFELTADNAPAVVELCVRLDGLPLAIELAAARLSLFSPQALVERLGSGLNLLKGGRRDAPERQRTLRDTIRWSYELLTVDEQRLLALFSLFSGATLEAVEGVAGRVTGFEAIDALDGFSSLIDKSLVRQTVPGAASPRLSMLETIREFAAERLAADPELLDAALWAHASYFADWTMHQCEKLTGEERESTSERMAEDIGNLSAAWRYWVEKGNFEELGRLTDGLWLLYDARGWYHETATIIRDLLEVLASTPSSHERRIQQILLQTSLARVLMASKGFTRETEEAYERSLQLCEAQGEVPQLLPVLRGLSTYFIYRAEFEKSMRIGEQLLAIAERFDDVRAQVEGHLLVGVSEGMFARLQVGIDHLEQGIASYDVGPRTVERFETGNDAGVVCHLADGMLLWMKGYPDRAQARAQEGIELAERIHHPQSLAYAHFHAGLIHIWRREPDRAREHANAVIDLADAHEFAIWGAAASCLLGAAVALGGAVDDGLARFDAAVDQYRALKMPPVFWPSLLHLNAAILGLAGRTAEGLERIDEALGVIAELPEPQMMSSELLMLKAELLLASAQESDAERWFERAVQRADDLEAPMLQLRANLAVARLRRAQGQPEPARTMLHAAYERLTEGSTTVDMIEARELLDELDELDRAR